MDTAGIAKPLLPHAGWLCGLAVLAGSWCALPAPAQPDDDGVESAVSLLEFVIEVDTDTAVKCLQTLRSKVQSGEVAGQRREALRQRLEETLLPILRGKAGTPLYDEAVLLAAVWGEPAASQVALEWTFDPAVPAEQRAAAMDSLAAAQNPMLLDRIGKLLTDPQQGALAGHALDTLSSYDQPVVAQIVLKIYQELPEELRPRAIELLTRRPAWSKSLLAAIGKGQVPREALHVNQVARLLSSPDTELAGMVRQQWGTVRTERNPQRLEVIAQMTELLTSGRGDPQRGRAVYQKVCGQCHQLHGEGQTVGPDITRNGRGSFEQLLSNVFDPSLVIGAAYQARTVITTDGRVLTGLLAEDNDQRIVLKTQGGKQEVVPRDQVDEVVTSQLSLMPEGLERQISAQEMIDLFSYLVIESPPGESPRVLIQGTPSGLVP